MRKIYQHEWFGINFSSLSVESSHKNIAGVDFYAEFYEAFYKKYHSYKELPHNWLLIKDEIVEHLSTFINNNSTVLSIGCGNGYIENELTSIVDCNMVAIEPSINSTQWVNKEKIELLDGLFPSVLQNKYLSSDFDFVYASGIDYVFDDDNYSDFLKSVLDFGIEDFLLTEVFIPSDNFLSIMKSKLATIASQLNVYNLGQFWGYLRTIKEHQHFFMKAGFSSLNVGQYNHGAYWIRAKK